MRIDMQENETQTKRHKEPYDLSNFRIMIIEDSPFIANLLSSALNEMGVSKVIVANDITTCKEKLLNFNAVSSSQNIDVAIIDWLMPDGDGMEILKWLRNHKSDTIKYLPAILCSAYTDTSLVEKSRDNGANEVMVKPVSAEKLASRILYVIDKPRPYIQTPDFFGPDRRRKNEKYNGDDRRVMKSDDIEEEHERLE